MDLVGLDKEKRQQIRKTIMEERDQWERQNLGRFRQSYPSDDQVSDFYFLITHLIDCVAQVRLHLE